MLKVAEWAANESALFIWRARLLDRKADRSASSKDQSARKQRLLDGPAEFTAVRVDRSKKTPNDAE